MSIQQRRERERAERHELIIRVARELAEAEGWDSVTTRRLAERIEYSQPVLYSHFKGKDEIVEAVALQGFAELATAMHDARSGTADARAALSAVLHAYARFAAENPVLYGAMFARATKLPFGRSETPAPLRVAFGELVAVFGPLAEGRDVETLVEVGWSALHGLIALNRDGRLRAEYQEQRLELLVDALLVKRRQTTR